MIHEPAAVPSMLGQMVRASAWAIALRWSVRGTGLISTIILARLLTPQDFGVVAMAMILVGALEIFSETGQQLALIRHPAPTRDHFDSAWTISILIGLILAVVIYLSAPAAGWYFGEPRAPIVVRVLALRALLGGFENIGVVMFRRELNFSREFQYLIYQKFASFVVTVSLAVALRNYWALVAGILVGRVATLCLSYGMNSFRPRVSFAKVGEIWSFSIWLLIKHIGTYLATKLDEFFVGGMAGTAAMGRYNVANDVGSAPSNEFVAPVAAAMFPVMAKFQHEPAKLLDLYLRILAWMTVICTSTSAGVALVSDDIAVVVLGSQWTDASRLIAWLALAAGVSGITNSSYGVFEIGGMPRLSARMQWTRLALLLLVFPALSWTKSVELFAIARLALAAIMGPMLLIAVRRVMPISMGMIMRALWRPFAAAAALAMGIATLRGLLPLAGIARLATEISSGIVIYVGTLLATWWLSGRPAGPEADIINWSLSRLRR